eukprot:CAMPEP_0117047170 /NCGR_PEP_ID=MMETSP0472-20121206/32606_1 /TAXON_ID=693140 ORGANISM="Tiarina fusus, Strain LIS" /NCGR_SAMPLE_ID=MMETSP0472 /ASSEMBLY_ACC=CAM_ASM_000603 /LENGTH=187 /DNA_ID=CAMNT_0004759783 /DNA_START=815 /DNA_END=1374 /DNA_ORIENTATION=+
MKTKLPKIAELKAFTDSQTKNTTLLDLIDFGITCDNPSEIFIALRNELDSVTEYPVLIAIDEVNCLYGKTGFMKPIHLREEKIAWVDGQEISIIKAITRPQSTLINGTTISSLTTQQPKKAFLKALGKDFTEARMEIPPYSRREYGARVNHYVECGDLISPPTVMTEQYIYQVCGGRPKHVASYYAT